MAGWAEMNASSRSGALAAVAIVAALVGWAVWKAPDRSAPAPGQSETAAEAAPEAAAETAPAETAAAAAPAEAAPEAAAEASPEATAEAAPEAPVIPPTIDVLRVAPDGTTTLAGRAGPGEVISVLVDGAETATVAADGAGQFATIFTLSPSATARMLSLLARAPDGTVTEGAEEVAIAPMPEPEPQAVAEAAPEAAPATDSAAPAGDETAAAAEPAGQAEAAAAAEPAGQAEAAAAAPAAEQTTETAAAPAPEPAAEAAEAAPEAPAAIIITDAGAEVLQAPGGAAAAAPAEAVTLQVISYAADGAVQLGGTGAAGATLRFYLDNAEVASATVAADGTWSLTGADIAPGIYTLRIDQLDSAGVVASRIETPFKRETLEALAAAAAPAAEPAAEAAPAAETAPEATAATTLSAEAPAQPEAPADDTTAALPQADAGAATAGAETAAAVPGADTAPQPSAAPITVTVQPGFTLWAIARKNLGRGILYVLVFEANRDQIRDPDLIYPGQVLSLPASP
ncbi:MAG: LysM peptidoglycan-binding domain-containing protein [Paracoccaceae bacterium]